MPHLTTYVFFHFLQASECVLLGFFLISLSVWLSICCEKCHVVTTTEEGIYRSKWFHKVADLLLSDSFPLYLCLQRGFICVGVLCVIVHFFSLFFSLRCFVFI